MSDLFSTDTLNYMVEDTARPPNALLDRYFPFPPQLEDSEEIHFDVDKQKRRVAPFVSPLVAGRVVETEGHTTKSFRPAYVKDKRIFNPNQAMKRWIGEPVGGDRTPQQRIEDMVLRDLTNQRSMLQRRLELMASEIIRTGQVTVAGEGYPTTVVNFLRAAALDPADLAGTEKWDDLANSLPLDNLETWALLVKQESGVWPRDVIMGVDAFKSFRKNADVKAQLDLRNLAGVNVDRSAAMDEGLTFRGLVDSFNIFVYAGWYVDPAGVEQVLWPATEVAMVAPTTGEGIGLDGIQAFGAIQDHDAGLIAAPEFVKSWTQDDPSVRYLMMQSAPLAVPRRINASMAIKVQ